MRGGYSLFEVLVAFAIMSAVLAVLLPGQNRLLARGVNGEQRVLAHDFAQSELARIGLDIPLERGTATGSYREWDVRRVIAQDGPDILRVEIEILDAAGRQLALVSAARVPQ